MARKITVLLVDDHALVRRGFRRILEDEIFVSIVGEASDGAEAVEMARTLKPNVILMDCAMPGMNGIAATGEIVKTCRESAVLMLSMYSEDSRVSRAVEAGVRGYLLKNTADLDLVSAIRRIAAGEMVLDPQLSKHPVPEARRDCDLSPRELEILHLIVYGKSNKEIAVQLGLSENTIGVHRANLMAHTRRSQDSGSCRVRNPQGAGQYCVAQRCKVSGENGSRRSKNCRSPGLSMHGEK